MRGARRAVFRTARAFYCTTAAEQRRQQWQVFNSLDLQQESAKVRLAYMLRELSQLVGDSADQASEAAPLRLELIAAAEDEALLRLPTGELDTAGLVSMIRHVEQGGLLHHSAVTKILDATDRRWLADCSPMTRLPAPKGRECVTVVGDLHGQFADLVQVLQQCGLPSDRNCIVFNGDMVDRGSQGLETMLTAWALKSIFPDNVHINRGNHEDDKIVRVFNFEAEVLDKYPTAGRQILDRIFSMWCRLPVCTLVESRAFIVHGGVPRGITGGLDDLEQKLSAEDRSSTLTEGSVVQDLLWSDPDLDERGSRPNESRGAGCFYGIDSVADWLQQVGVTSLIRSHECVVNGVERHDCGAGFEMYTVFSCTNYPNFNGMNKAAVLRLHAIAHNSAKVGPPPIETIVLKTTDDEEPELQRLIENNQRAIGELIFANRTALAERFAAVSEGGGLVSKQVWAEVLDSVIGRHIDWLAMEASLVPSAKSQVSWESFLNQYQLAGGGGDSASLETLYKNHEMLTTVFRFVDADGSGKIDRSEFTKAVELLGRLEGSETKLQLDADDLFSLMDFDGDGSISLNEWCESFRIVQT